jgi:hypothetical protein
VCHDEVVVECNAQQAEDVKVWLQKAMIEGMDAITNGRDEVQVPVEVEARIARSWGEGGESYVQTQGRVAERHSLGRKSFAVRREPLPRRLLKPF